MDENSGIRVEIERFISEKLDAFNAGKTKGQGRYYILVPHEKSVYYTLWYYAPQAVYHLYVFLERLELNLLGSLNKAMKIVANSFLPLAITDHTDRLFESPSNYGDDLITFGKYRGHTLQEVYSIDPRYVSWLADKYEPRVKNEFRFKELAQAYHRVYVDLHTPRKYKVQRSRYVGTPGEKLADLELTVTRVRVEDDPYKTRVVRGTEYFYVDQVITAVDREGNLYAFTVKAPDRSLQSQMLNASVHAYQPGEKLTIASAKVLRHFESRNLRYTRLGYVRFKNPGAAR